MRPYPTPFDLQRAEEIDPGRVARIPRANMGRHRVGAVLMIALATAGATGCRNSESKKETPSTTTPIEVAPPAPKRVSLNSIDWDAAPRWSRELQFDANGGAVYDWSCPEVAALKKKQEAKPAQDEFEKREHEASVVKAKADCVAQSKAAAKPLPEFALVEFDVELDGEFNFEGAFFPMRLKKAENRNAASISVRETGCKRIDGVRVLALMMSADNGKSDAWTLPYDSGLAAAPAPEKYFPEGSNEFRLPSASTDMAKQLKPRLKTGATAQILLALADPKNGTGVVFQKPGSFGLVMREALNGTRARPIALRFAVSGEVAAGPFDLQE